MAVTQRIRPVQKPVAGAAVHSTVTAEKETSQKEAGGSQADLASTLLAFEGGVRALVSEAELFARWCNDTRRFLGYLQAFLLRSKFRDSNPKLIAGTSLPGVDRDSPFVRWLEKIVGRMRDEVGMDEVHHFTLPAYCDEGDEEASSYPFVELFWTPLKEDGSTVGGFLGARETPWLQNEQLLTERFYQVYVHSWQSIKGRGRLARKRPFARKWLTLAVVAALLLALLPVSITALAPVEVVPRDPLMVAAPINGVVKDILVDQGSPVASGDALITFEDVEWRNELQVANENESVARARYQRESQRAISDARAKREIAVARAELELATTEKRYAEELLDKTRISASGYGLAVYTDKRDWIGKPVSAGETILQIADPQKVQFSIDLPVRESLVLNDGARVKVFLDSDPLNPLEAKLTEASYQALRDKRDILSHRLAGEMSDPQQVLPRIGVQGTAQIYGDKAPLIYVLLRKPIASLRQFTGW